MWSKWKGWEKVFAFTFVQTWKSKSTIITTVIITLLAMGALPLMGAISKYVTETEEGVYDYEKVYVIDETGMELHDFSGMAEVKEPYKDVEFVNVTNQSQEDIIKQIQKKKEKALVTTLTYAPEEGFFFHSVYAEKGSVREESAYTFSEDVSEYFSQYLLKNLDIDKTALAYIDIPVRTKTVALDSKGNVKKKEKGTGISGTEYTFSYAVLFIFMMCVTMSGEGIASAIVVEKANRVVEYLLTAIEPMAIVVGKVIARMTVILLQFLVAGAGFGISTAFLLTSGEDGSSIAGVEQIKGILESDLITKANPGMILIALLMMLVGFLFYGMLAGMAGATVSKVEDTTEGLKLFTIIILIGVYLALAIIMTGLNGNGNPTLENIGYFLPLSSPFIIPSYLWLGKVSMGKALLSLGILLVCTIVEIYFVSAVYGSMIFHNGNKLKIKDIVGMFKENTGTKKTMEE